MRYLAVFHVAFHRTRSSFCYGSDTLLALSISLSYFREMLIGFVIASVCSGFISKVSNDQRVNVCRLNEQTRRRLGFIQTTTSLEL